MTLLVTGCFDAAKPDPSDTAATALFDTTQVAVDTPATVDVPNLDVAAKPDAVALECPSGPGCACLAHTDCQTGLCIDDPGNATGNACARKCVDTCPDGYACAPVNGSGGDISTICVPKFGHLCDPCATSKDCEALGLKDSACVEQDALGRFCGVACNVASDCPKDYACQDVATAEGGKLKQCVRSPDTASSEGFGVCPCSAAAVQKKLATACYVAVKDATGKVVGKCGGTRACLSAGLAACTANPASAEVCDGKDNDCDGATDESACDDGNPCTDDKCDPTAATACSHANKTGAACEADNSACTAGDSCQDGKCVVGKAKDCDDKNPCTQDSCDLAKGCTQVHDDGKPCDADGNLCTQGDVCQGGTCKQGATAGCDDDNPCTIDGCDKKTGQCTSQALDDGVPCDDGTLCTDKDACKGGVCKGKAIVCEDNNPCTADVCDAKLGCQLKKLSGAPCDDDNLCTIGDQCADGDCAPGKVKTCVSPDACYSAKCGLVDGKCKITEATAGSACDDGNACTGGDGCSGGNCAGTVKSCDDGNPCTDDGCSAKSGCTATLATKPCDDGNACTELDGCKGGACVGLAKAASSACDDGNPCTADGCDAKAGCVHSPQAGNCDDGNSCTQSDTCQAGACAGGTSTCACQSDSECAGQDDSDLCNGTLFCDKAKLPYVCKVKPSTIISCDGSQDGPCAVTVCEPKSGTCGKSAAADGKGCDADGSLCTESDACKQGNCAAGVSAVCDDKNPCTTDGCDAKAGCVFAANSQGCDADGDACTVGDVCKGKVCLGGAKKVCDDGEICTADGCDKGSGKCVFAGKGQDGTACDADGSVCSEGDACASGACVAGKAKVCDDGNLCTDDGCDAKLGCKAVANSKPCDDGTTCTGGDACGQGACAGVPINAQVVCDDYNPCSSDACDGKLGCVHAANKQQCDDGNPCTVGDVCADKACVAGTNTCGCEADSACAGQEDGDFCNGTLFCDKAKLPYVCKVNVKSIVVCDTAKDTACLATLCTAKTGACDKVAATAGKGCDADGSVCTEGDACKAGVCGAGAVKACDDGNGCTDDSCDAKAGCVHLANAGSCTDGNACTVGDKCVGGDCEAKAANCNDGNPCTDDGCDKVAGCKWVPNAVVCDDGSACTAGDLCGAGKCTGKVVACDDGDPCTQDGCEAVKGCLAVAVVEKAGCSADGGKWCVGGKCVVKAVCGDGVVAGAEACDDGNLVPVDGCGPQCTVECGATAFNGATDHVAVSDSAALRPGTGEFTLEAIVKLPGAGMIFQKRVGENYFLLTSTAVGQDIELAAWFVSASGWAIVTADTVFSSNVWHHVVVQRVAGAAQIFVDGKESATKKDVKFGSADLAQYDIANTGPFNIGFNTDGNGTQFLKGTLQVVRWQLGRRYFHDFLPSSEAIVVPPKVGFLVDFAHGAPGVVSSASQTILVYGNPAFLATGLFCEQVLLCASSSAPLAMCADGNATPNDGCSPTCQLEPFPSCKAILAKFPNTPNGLYLIDPDGSGPIAPANLFCDMKAGGWTLVGNYYDSPGDDMPNTTDFVVSGWQQTASGKWDPGAKYVDRAWGGGAGSAAVSLAFVEALGKAAGQKNLRMCFVHKDGYDTSCRQSSDGSMTLVAYDTGNPKLTVYKADKLTYTFGRLGGLAGSVDGYDYSKFTDPTPSNPGAGYCAPRSVGLWDEFGTEDKFGLCQYPSVLPATPNAFGVWNGWGSGMSYRPSLADGGELGNQSGSNPNVATWGFRLYIGPDPTLGSQAQPAPSCKAIIDAKASLGNGAYWLDPDAAGPIAPFQASCDMTVDGGGWTIFMLASAPVAPPDTTKTLLDPTGAAGYYYMPNALFKSLGTNGKRVRAWSRVDPGLYLECDFQTAGTNYKDWTANANCVQSVAKKAGGYALLPIPGPTGKGVGFTYQAQLYNTVNPRNPLTDNSVFAKDDVGAYAEGWAIPGWSAVDETDATYTGYYGEWATTPDKAMVYAIR